MLWLVVIFVDRKPVRFVIRGPRGEVGPAAIRYARTCFGHRDLRFGWAEPSDLTSPATASMM